MTPITMYRADDGAVFNTPEHARARDVMHADFAARMAPLGPKRELYSNDYIQHDPAVVARVRASVVRAALSPDTNGLNEVIRRIEAGETLAESMIGRLLDGDDPRSRAWFRLCCIDAAGREWQQPYFAINGNPDGVERRPA